MQFELTGRDAEIAALAKQVGHDVLQPQAAATDAGLFPAQSLRAMGTTGLLGIKIRKEYGGLQGGNVAYVAAIRELAGVCASTAVTVAVTNMVGDMIQLYGSEEQRQRHLPHLTSGHYLAGSFALSETGAGSDAAALRTRAERDGDSWILNGSKMWITSGDVAGVTLVMAKTDATKGSRGITAFLVEAGTPGLEIGRHEEKLGLRGSSTVALNFVDCRLPDAARLGAEGQGFEIAMTALDSGRCGIGGQALGMGYRVLAESARHLEGRKKADKLVGTDQNSQFRLADMAMRLDAAWLMVLRAAWLRDQGKKMSREAAMAKVMATEAGDFAAKTAMQLVGASALDARHPVARALRDVRVSRIYEGTSEIQRLVIARSLAASV